MLCFRPDCYNPAMKQRRSQIGYMIILSAALVARLLPGPRTIDDAYITYRYVRNLLSGNGFVFNPGEHILGTTTPLYTLLLTLIGAPFGSGADLILLAWIGNAIAGVFVCIMILAIGKRLGHQGAGMATAAIWAIAPMGVTFAIGGMETSLFIALVLASFHFHLAGQRTWLAACAAAVLLTRPDGLLFLAPLGIEQIRQVWKGQSDGSWQQIATPVAVLVIPLGLWAVFATAYFGSPITHSVTAKVAAYQLAPEAATVRLLQHYATPFLGHITFGNWWIAVGLIVFPALFVVGAIGLIRSGVETWPLFVAPWLYFAAFSIANPLIFRWYLAPPLPLYMFGILVGVSRLSKDLRVPQLLPLCTTAFLLMTLNGWVLHPDHGPDRPAPEMAYIKLELLYEQVGRELRTEIEGDQVIGAGDVGALGYFSGARILDTLGIISPQATSFYPADPELYVINYAVPPELVSTLAPDYLVILEAYGRGGLLQDARFQQEYDKVADLETDIYGSRGMLVFHRASGTR